MYTANEATCSALNALENHGNTLANTDAHGAKRKTPLGTQKLIASRSGKPGAAGSERMPDGDGASIRIDVGGIVGETKFTEDGQRLGGECFVERRRAGERRLRH